MAINCGIVGLPNVGKSTLFNALTATAAAEASNYPFCTIEPNTGRVSVPDARMEALVSLAKPQKTIPTFLEFVDIAGLVRGASKGEGLGNQFLANIREVDAVLHVVRCFADDNIVHVEGSVDPIRDIETIETELMLADLDSLEKRVVPLAKKAKGNDKDAQMQLAVMERCLAALRDGKPARLVEVSHEEEKAFKGMQLLTSKPVLYVCNVDEGSAAEGNEYTERVFARAQEEGAQAVVISAAIEQEIAQLGSDAEKAEFLESMGLHETGLARVIRAAYSLLGLITFFTVGPKEVRAWTLRKGAKAPEAAGTIHTDFERGFICAETIGYDDYVKLKGEQGAKEAGRMRQEGRDYTVHDGDVMLFRFNV
jgi:GTP-binding protein YchF